jgi:hypothetical protein
VAVRSPATNVNGVQPIGISKGTWMVTDSCPSTFDIANIGAGVAPNRTEILPISKGNWPPLPEAESLAAGSKRLPYSAEVPVKRNGSLRSGRGFVVPRTSRAKFPPNRTAIPPGLTPSRESSRRRAAANTLMYGLSCHRHQRDRRFVRD